MELAKSNTAITAYQLVQELQAFLVATLDQLPPKPSKSRFQPISWLRAQGRYGGGTRYVASDEVLFNRASVNVSQVQYENDPNKSLGSASAISTIVHPRRPHIPSMHMHISWTENKKGSGYWRIMADLNPSLAVAADRELFLSAIREVLTPELYRYGTEQGDRYFYIPALKRHRGIAHFYLEEFNRGDFAGDLALARQFGRQVITTYGGIVDKILRDGREASADELQQQRRYHSIYFLQVLTLDRGTTSGLLVHDENDVGILGSLPAYVDKALLTTFVPQLPPLQQTLLKSLLSAVPDAPSALIDDSVKIQLAKLTRQFYLQHPEAQELLARADKLPPTQQNHS